MSDKSEEKELKEHLARESLFKVYLDIKSQIKDKPIEIDKEEYEETIASTSLEQFSKYIIDSIEILVNTKIKEALSQFEKDQMKKLNKSREVTKFDLYEGLLRKNENRNRMLIKHYFQSKLQKEALELKIAEYMDMEDEFEEMRTKYKYESGKFLNNDRKDNEILIIRTENTNLKKVITNLEKKVSEEESNLKDKDKTIKNLNSKIDELNSKLEEKEKELKEINLCSSNKVVANYGTGSEYNTNSTNPKCNGFYLSTKDKDKRDTMENNYNAHNSQGSITSNCSTKEYIPHFNESTSKRVKNCLNSSAINLKYYNPNISGDNSLQGLTIKYQTNKQKRNSDRRDNSRRKVMEPSFSNKTNYGFGPYPVIEKGSSVRHKNSSVGNVRPHVMRKELSYCSIYNKNIFN
ncbi:MAG: hypothetical protein MJ252_17240 [archaeon]|nr:hypothetical protein [archaeon]